MFYKDYGKSCDLYCFFAPSEMKILYPSIMRINILLLAIENVKQ